MRISEETKKIYLVIYVVKKRNLIARWPVRFYQTQLIKRDVMIAVFGA